MGCIALKNLLDMWEDLEFDSHIPSGSEFCLVIKSSSF